MDIELFFDPGPSGNKEEERHKGGGTADQQAEGDAASPDGQGGANPEAAAGGKRPPLTMCHMPMLGRCSAPALLFAVSVNPTDRFLLALLAAGWGTRGGSRTTRCHRDQEPMWPDSVHPGFG